VLWSESRIGHCAGSQGAFYRRGMKHIVNALADQRPHVVPQEAAGGGIRIDAISLAIHRDQTFAHELCQAPFEDAQVFLLVFCLFPLDVLADLRPRAHHQEQQVLVQRPDAAAVKTITPCRPRRFAMGKPQALTNPAFPAMAASGKRFSFTISPNQTGSPLVQMYPGSPMSRA